MSLYTPESLIRKIILEAEDLTLTPSPDAQEFSGGSTPEEIAARATPPAPAGPMGAPGLGGQSLTLPSVAQPTSTIMKTVINKDIILAQLAELKSVITGAEKQFDGDDLTPEDANIYISRLLSTLVFHAETLNKFLEGQGSPEQPEAASAEPLVQPEIPQV